MAEQEQSKFCKIYMVINFGVCGGLNTGCQIETLKENTMKPSTKDQAQGKFHEVKGKVK
jgi:hypothetical protein